MLNKIKHQTTIHSQTYTHTEVLQFEICKRQGRAPS